MAFHVNCLPSRWFTLHVNSHFLWKIIMKIFRMSSATILPVHQNLVFSEQIQQVTNNSIYSKYWDTLSTYYTCPKIWNSQFYYLLMCLKYWCIYVEQSGLCSACTATVHFAYTISRPCNKFNLLHVCTYW